MENLCLQNVLRRDLEHLKLFPFVLSWYCWPWVNYFSIALTHLHIPPHTVITVNKAIMLLPGLVWTFWVIRLNKFLGGRAPNNSFDFCEHQDHYKPNTHGSWFRNVFKVFIRGMHANAAPSRTGHQAPAEVNWSTDCFREEECYS